MKNIIFFHILLGNVVQRHPMNVRTELQNRLLMAAEYPVLREQLLRAFRDADDEKAAEIVKVIDFDRFEREYGRWYDIPDVNGNHKAMVKTLKTLAERGVTINHLRGHPGPTVLEILVERDYETQEEVQELADLANTLLKCGASQYILTQPTIDCLLYTAIRNSLSEIAVALIEDGAPVNWKGACGQLLTTIAFQLGHPIILMKLMQHGACVDPMAYLNIIKIRLVLFLDHPPQPGQESDPRGSEMVEATRIIFRQANLAHLARMKIRDTIYHTNGKPLLGITRPLAKLKIPEIMANYLNFRYDFDHIPQNHRAMEF